MSRRVIQIFLLGFMLCASFVWADSACLMLNGKWQAGLGRNYDQAVPVPGMLEGISTREATKGVVWYKRETDLPEGDWSHATLLLKGACFHPAVYVNGKKVSEAEGGLTPSFHLLASPDVVPGKTVGLEVALESMADIGKDNPSYISKADHWRCNLASWIWDDVELITHGRFFVERVIPVADIDKKQVEVRWQVKDCGNDKAAPSKVAVEILSRDGAVLVSGEGKRGALSGETILEYGDKCRNWSPDKPNLYKLRISVFDEDGKISHQDTCNWAPRDFGLKQYDWGTGFELNGNPISLRGAGTVWRRWTRDEESHPVMNDREWIRNNLLKPMKERGANFIRFHLYLTPEFILDMCDEMGLIVDSEWHFFHGYQVKEDALRRQWIPWFDVVQRHPSVMVMQPYNESSSPATKTTLKVALEKEKEYQPTVYFHRDIKDVHFYWWSLFENLCLYYDSPEFEGGMYYGGGDDSGNRALLVGEFGGNYMDGDYNVGGYGALKWSFPRFLGPDHSVETRRWLLNVSSGRIGEYWRRMKAPAISVFCIIGSFEDGCHWYEGDQRKGQLKPVWNWMTPVWSARSVSLDLWHRNFVPGQNVTAPLHFINETDEKAELVSALRIRDEQGSIISEKTIKRKLIAFDHKVEQAEFDLPPIAGRYLLEAELLNPTDDVTVPVKSRWDVFVSEAKPDTRLQKATVGILPEEKELKDFLNSFSVQTSGFADADVLLGSRETWERIERDAGFRGQLEKLLEAGKGMVFLDVGPRVLDKEYPQDEARAYGFRTDQQNVNMTARFLFDYNINFTVFKKQSAESCIHPSEKGAHLWDGLDRMQTWLWNGLRGGVNVPSVAMEAGLSRSAFLSAWQRRGADVRKIKAGRPVIAYELAGFYAFSEKKNDQKVMDELTGTVKKHAEDAPAIAELYENRKMQVFDLTEHCKKLREKSVEADELVVHGPGANRSSVIRINYPGAKVILSQLITAGRLGGKPSSPAPYAICRDEAARQMVLNMLKDVL